MDTCDVRLAAALLRQTRTAALGALLIFSLARIGAQPDPENVASPPTERMISGIHVNVFAPGDRIQQVIRKYGQPKSHEDAVVPDGAGGTRFDTWELPGVKMRVATYFSFKGRRFLFFHWIVKQESRVAYVDVWGEAAHGMVGTTGRGLVLGATLAEQKALYGEKYKLQYTDSNGVQYVEIWWSDETCLMIDYGPNGRSQHMRLTSKEQ